MHEVAYGIESDRQRTTEVLPGGLPRVVYHALVVLSIAISAWTRRIR